MGENFDQQNAYQAKGETFFDDGREIRLLHHIHSRPNVNTEIRNNPTAVLREIDNFARSDAYLMNVGPDKGRIVSSLIAERKPKVMLELGGYIGYSCILFGAAVRDASGGKGKYYSLERNPEFAAVIMCLVELAGLRDTVRVVVGSAEDSLRQLKEEGVFANSATGGGIDLMFLDHFKPAYRTDLQLCEELGLIKKGSTMAGDNCIEPGNPAYLEYVRASPSDKRGFLEKQENGEGWDPRMAEKSVNQYNKREGEGKRNTNVKGDPSIIYESKMVESFEPTGEKDGVEITTCVGFES